MKERFNDIFETINLMHKKYNSKNYLENLEELKKSSNDLAKILEKYKVSELNNVLTKKSGKKGKKKIKFSRNNKNQITEKDKNLNRVEAI